MRKTNYWPISFMVIDVKFLNKITGKLDLTANKMIKSSWIFFLKCKDGCMFKKL